ncbi:MAG: MOSC domain-containing protein YiiM [Planctomycetota bacterium]
MALSARFDLWYMRLNKSPKDNGRICGLVMRPPEGGHGARKIALTAEFSPESGMHGDRWATEERQEIDNQVTLINIHVIASLAKDPERYALCGDNLQVDLGLTEANLPAGFKLEIGSVVLEVSAQPHLPCKHFYHCFGASAVKKVVRANRKSRRGRDAIRVLRAKDAAV